jgi:hypothetical protein
MDDIYLRLDPWEDAFGPIRAKVRREDEELTFILIKLLEDVDLDVMRDSKYGVWLPIFRRLMDERSPNHPLISDLLQKIGAFVRSQSQSKTIHGGTFYGKSVKYNNVARTLDLVLNPEAFPPDDIFDNYYGRMSRRKRTMQSVLVNLRYKLGDADAEYLMGFMKLSPEESGLSRWEKFWMGANRKLSQWLD